MSDAKIIKVEKNQEAGHPQSAVVNTLLFDALRPVVINECFVMAEDAVRNAHAHLPAEWGDEDGHDGEAPQDATTIYVVIGEQCESEFYAVLSFSLAEMVRSAIEINVARNEDDDYFLPDEDGSIRRIRDGLADLVQEMDRALSGEPI